MRCYFCEKEVQVGFYWVPLPRVGSYAVVCRECNKRIREEEKAKREVKA